MTPSRWVPGDASAGAERRALLAALFAARVTLAETLRSLRGADEAGRAPAEADVEAASRRLRGLAERYASRVPVVPLTRCPYTGGVLERSIDVFGLDGPWWDCRSPERPVEEEPASLFALAGAVRLVATPSPAPFLCKPGPGRPWVDPRLLDGGRVRAVLSALSVGPHPAWVIAYFAQPMAWDLRRPNTWGLRHGDHTGPDGSLCREDVPDVAQARDFALDGWIRRGALHWIAPGDPALRLRATLGDCPYLGLDGPTDPVCIEDGRVWSALDGTPAAAGGEA